MTVHRKGYEYREMPVASWLSERASLVADSWELVSVDGGVAYLKRWWNEGEWDGEPPECGMW